MPGYSGSPLVEKRVQPIKVACSKTQSLVGQAEKRECNCQEKIIIVNECKLLYYEDYT